jgi:hypothetical protein
VSYKKTFKQLQSSAESNPLLFLGGALGAGLLLGKVAPSAVGALLKLGGGLAWKFLVLPAIAERVAAAVEGEDVKLGPLDSESALELVGLRPRPSAFGRLLGTVGLLGAGFAAGAGLGLAFAPQPGVELRRQLSQRLRDVTKTGPESAINEPVA